MIVASQQNSRILTLARSQRSPNSRVLRGRHLRDALEFLVQRLARSSGLNHGCGQGKLFVARRCVWDLVLCTQPCSPVQPPRGSPSFSTEFTASTKNEKR